ncbi:MAG: DNA-binding transcriptional regulator Fis [Pseudomonadota bacterium]|nr:DNA-binding transcriptional regulator Fis [Pseudomonadota bacterium]
MTAIITSTTHNTPVNTYTKEFKVREENAELPLRDCVRHAVDAYFKNLNGHSAQGLYALLLSEVEKPLLQSVMQHTGSNQSRSAKVLGISRSTLRKKLKQYDID